MNRSMFEKVFSYLLSGGLACAILVLGLSLLVWKPDSPTTAPGGDAEWPRPFELDQSLLTAKAAVVYDPIAHRVLYAKNADTRLPLASITKLISAQAVLARKKEDDLVLITPESLAPEGDWGFWVGEEWPVKELVDFALAASSNDAIQAAALSLGPNYVEIMNGEARELGLTNTQILNPTGLDEDLTTAGSYGTALDIAVLAAAFLNEHPTYYEVTAAPSVTIAHGSRMLTATSTAVPLLDMPGLIGAKTGFTDLAGGNLVAAFDLELGKPVVIAVLGSTVSGRFEDVKLLLTHARKK